jgi:SM-20-related protein
MNPILIDNFFPADMYDNLRNTVRAAPMSYGSKSNSKTDPHGHWSWKPIHDSTHNLADLTGYLDVAPVQWSDLADGWKFLRHSPHLPMNVVGGAKLIRCYANGYTYGTDGYFHTDSDRDGDLTVIIYICDEWMMDWAGETVCTNGPTYWSYLPRPNRVLVLPSNMRHAARAVSRKCTALRTTLMYKCRPARDQAFEKHSSWLRDVGALAIDHSTGSLHDHLMRCYDLLKGKVGGHDSITHQVATAGGLHSIYGTNAFTKVLLEPHASNRAWVADQFGREAEELAYLFHLLDRPKVLEYVKLGEGDCFLEYRFNKFGWHNAATTRALQLIECANLADQDSLAKWPNLLKLWKGESK